MTAGTTTTAGTRSARTRRLRRAAVCTAAALTVTLSLAGCKDTTLGADPSSGGPGNGKVSSGPPPKGPQGSALAAADKLPVKGRAPKTGYSREQFGPEWSDTDHNGCDTRVISMLRRLATVFSQFTTGVQSFAY